MGSNMVSYLKDLKESVVDYVMSSQTNHYVTEQGAVENWENKYTPEVLTEIFDKQIKEVEDFVKKNTEQENQTE